MTSDSFTNFLSRVGISTGNQSSAGGYSFNPVTRLRVLLDFAYRGSWIVGVAVDAIADDMTRAGIDFGSELLPDEGDRLHRAMVRHRIWWQINNAIKNARLYGGAIAVLLIKDQDPSTPLRTETIRPGQFVGLEVLDRWMVNPSLEDLVTDLGTDLGMPKFYRVTADAPALPRMSIHYTRCLRFDGDYLPYWQRISENLWSMSVIERLYDRLLAFDSATQGAAQLVYKAHLRTLSIPDLRKILAMGGQPGVPGPYDSLIKNVEFLRAMQTNEGLSLIDGGSPDGTRPPDKFETHQYSFAGLSDIIIQFGQQISGAIKVPLVRLFGQSPIGLNSTGESDLRNYYDGLNAKQENDLRLPLERVIQCEARSERITLPDTFWFTFKPLWLLREQDKVNVAQSITAGAVQAFTEGLIPAALALKELRQSSRTTGVWTNITDEDIEEAAQNPPSPTELNVAAERGGEGVEAEPGGEAEPDPGASAKGAKEEDDRQLRVVGGREPPKTPISAAGLIAKGRPTLPAAARVVRSGAEMASGAAEHAATVRGIGKAISRVAGARHFVFDHLAPIDGIEIIIETPKGTSRQGSGWTVAHMPADYGYIRATEGADGEQIDVFVGSNHDSQRAWLIDQINPRTAKFDEHKVMLGFDDKASAVACYEAAFTDGSGASRIGGMTELSLTALRDWLRGIAAAE
jgi:uncharacterized protein